MVSFSPGLLRTPTVETLSVPQSEFHHRVTSQKISGGGAATLEYQIS